MGPLAAYRVGARRHGRGGERLAGRAGVVPDLPHQGDGRSGNGNGLVGIGDVRAAIECGIARGIDLQGGTVQRYSGEQSAAARPGEDLRQSCASVAAAASRPTGPAAAAASAPSVNLPRNRPCTLLRVLKTNTISVTCRPICQPTLPPVSVTKAGGRQKPRSSRTMTIPRPCRTPSTNPPFTKVGNDDDALGVGQQGGGNPAWPG